MLPPMIALPADSPGYVLSRRGSAHAVNDDCYALLDARNAQVREAGRGVIYAVADGVGSTSQGHLAAELCCETLAEFFTTSRPASEDLIIDLIETADAQVRLTTSSASTLAGLWMMAGQARVFCLGDSGVYRIHGGRLSRLTPKQVRGRGLAAYVGMGPSVRHALFLDRLYLHPDDVFLLLSDGVVQAVPEPMLAELYRRTPDPLTLMDTVQDELNRQNARDDATLIVVKVDNPYGFPTGGRRRG